MGKRPREPTISPQDTAAKKPVVKRPKTSKKDEEWVEVPARKNLRKKKPKPEVKESECLRRDSAEAVLIKPAKNIKPSIEARLSKML